MLFRSCSFSCMRFMRLPKDHTAMLVPGHIKQRSLTIRRGQLVDPEFKTLESVQDDAAQLLAYADSRAAELP